MWQAINKVLDRSSNSAIPTSLTVEGKRLSRERDLVQALNHHFVSVGQTLACQIEQNSNDDPLKHISQEESSINFTPVDCNYVRKAIQQLKHGKAPGPEKNPYNVDKICHRSYKSTVNYDFQLVLKEGVFPDILKVAKVTPIFKSGSRSDANNYRPISVVSVFPRILERIVHNQIYEHLKAASVKTMSQSAFQKCCSTITSLIDSTDKWNDNINDKQLNLTIFLDLKKAFDTVDHAILIGKLRKYGIRDIAGDWIQSYLENRKQYCAANGLNSGTKTVTCGILQGSCLGPLLFIIYLNDFEKCLVDSKAGLYADDTHITVASTNVENLIQNAQMELSNISTWMRINKLSANPKKTEYVIIGHPRKIIKSRYMNH